jgi:hypothetical protein
MGGERTGSPKHGRSRQKKRKRTPAELKAAGAEPKPRTDVLDEQAGDREVVGSVGSAVEGAPTEERRQEPRPDASNTRSQRPATRAIGVCVSCSCMCVKTPVVAHRCFVLPRLSILCGCA